MGQQIRPSQFILTYGVGSFIETIRGPRLIPAFEKWALFEDVFSTPGGSLRTIRDNGNARAQLGGAEIFDVPTNAQYDLPASSPLVRTYRFPHWALCSRHFVLYRLKDRGKTNCPQCKAAGRQDDCQVEGIRFVRACPRGHLDDVDWRGAIHGTAQCPGETYDWDESSGSELRNVTLRCSRCHARASLQDIYFRTGSCTGYFPEDGTREENCSEEASVVLRNAASLRLSRPVTALTIPPIALPIHSILTQPAFGDYLLNMASRKPRPREFLLQEALAGTQCDPETINAIEKTSEQEVTQAIKDILSQRNNNQNRTKMEYEVKEEEFIALQRAASDGYPAQRVTGLPKFEVDRHSFLMFPLPSGLQLRVTPIKRLTVVLVQKGYTRPVRGPRLDNGNPVPVRDTFLEKNGIRYYPGIEIRGEGIFIDMPEGNPKFTGRTAADMPPLIVWWWHSLAHRLIMALSLDSGYSSSAIRERIYYRPATPKNAAQGGILLYTSQHGGDGSLGGLIALATDREFPRVFAAAERNILACSNDPLCSENSGSQVNGAACYACMLVSETSCELQNIYLDRILLSKGLGLSHS